MPPLPETTRKAIEDMLPQFANWVSLVRKLIRMAGSWEEICKGADRCVGLTKEDALAIAPAILAHTMGELIWQSNAFSWSPIKVRSIILTMFSGWRVQIRPMPPIWTTTAIAAAAFPNVRIPFKPTMTAPAPPGPTFDLKPSSTAVTTPLSKMPFSLPTSSFNARIPLNATPDDIKNLSEQMSRQFMLQLSKQNPGWEAAGVSHLYMGPKDDTTDAYPLVMACDQYGRPVDPPFSQLEIDSMRPYKGISSARPKTLRSTSIPQGPSMVPSVRTQAPPPHPPPSHPPPNPPTSEPQPADLTNEQAPDPPSQPPQPQSSTRIKATDNTTARFPTPEEKHAVFRADNKKRLTYYTQLYLYTRNIRQDLSCELSLDRCLICLAGPAVAKGGVLGKREDAVDGKKEVGPGSYASRIESLYKRKVERDSQV